MPARVAGLSEWPRGLAFPQSFASPARPRPWPSLVRLTGSPAEARACAISIANMSRRSSVALVAMREWNV
eukprot:9170451-Pyramimonas_sp.AAC.1